MVGVALNALRVGELPQSFIGDKQKAKRLTHPGEKGWCGNLFPVLPKQDSSASTRRSPAPGSLKSRLRTLLFESNGFLHALVTVGSVLLVTRMLTDSQRPDPEHPFALRTASGFLFFLGPAILLHFFRLPPRQGLINLLVLCLTATFVFVTGDWLENHSSATVSHIGEVPSPLSYYLKLFLIGLLTLSPIVLFLLHRKSTLFDRYILHGFTAPFFFCLVAFSSIWLIFDLNDNLPDFRKGNSGLGQILKFYLVQLPFIFTKIAPASLLIAIVYSLSRLSRFNELVSMLSAGRSLGRILAPLFIFSFYISFVFLVFNYQWAPWAEGHKEGLLKQFKKGERGSTSAQR
ncbi:MAG: LptF/LptG family permease, partial [Verrucomicrobiota bacterium]